MKINFPSIDSTDCLFYYDGPILFINKNEIGTQLFVEIEENIKNKYLEYFIIPIDDKELKDYLDGKITLYSLYFLNKDYKICKIFSNEEIFYDISEENFKDYMLPSEYSYYVDYKENKNE